MNLRLPNGNISSPIKAGPSSLRMRRDALLKHIGQILPAIQRNAAILDSEHCFPERDVSALHECGALQAPLPGEYGGLVLGTEPEAAEHLSDLLQMLGYSHVAVGRLFEAHVNAVRLIAIHGSPSQISRAATDIAAGHLIALWVTDSATSPLRANESGKLQGIKSICSGAGHIERSLVTCLHPDGTTRLAYLSINSASATKLQASPQGLRAATTGQVDFGGMSITKDDWIGHPGDYLREPDFSAGAWRTSAVTAGCLSRLVDLAIDHLVQRNRAGNPHQQARIGRAWIARETARHWISSTARIAEGVEPAPPEAIVAGVNFARIAIESASVEALNLVERSVGLPAFLVGTEIERVRRDLGTYLRQPAPDEVLTEAAAHIVRTRHPTP
jgi:alkylation response protein AidB-like acyl-CoA dehydrogenase